jgi:hypothetical protein
MATRSFIGKMNKDDTITGIYCHWDGYPEYVGARLIDNYIIENQVDSLISLGDLSTLGKTLENCDSFGSRGEKNAQAKIYKDFDHFYEAGRSSWCEYFYVFNHDFWACWDVNKKRYDLNTLDPEKDEEES